MSHAILLIPLSGSIDSVCDSSWLDWVDYQEQIKKHFRGGALLNNVSANIITRLHKLNV